MNFGQFSCFSLDKINCQRTSYELPTNLLYEELVNFNILLSPITLLLTYLSFEDVGFDFMFLSKLTIIVNLIYFQYL